MKNPDEYKVKSLAKALNILNCFNQTNSELGVSEIAQITGYQKTTVHNVLATYQEFGYVYQNPNTDKYSLGLNLLQYSFKIINSLKIRQILLPYTMKISAKTDQICIIAVPHESQVFYIDSSLAINSERNMRHLTGERAPMYCTGIGKCMLAFSGEEFIDDYIKNTKLEKFTDYTITNPIVLREQLKEIRRNGYSVDNMEHEYNIRCVAIPLFDPDKNVIAALSVSGKAIDFNSASIVAYSTIMNEIISPIQNHIQL